MNILSIETSADETSVSVVNADGEFPRATYRVLGNALRSQIEMHKEYGGIFPTMAKREHAKALTPLLERALTESGMLTTEKQEISEVTDAELHELLSREEGLADTLLSFLKAHTRPDVDLIAVTSGPGLEPALWVGISFARALSLVWNIPVVPVNHMEGHVLVSLLDGDTLPDLTFPALALLISGGHTEFDLMKDWYTYECVGQTRDDAVGEAYDKVARMLGLSYPGGPEIERCAREARAAGITPSISLPRPMLDSNNLDFSFSGLKTAVRYALEKAPEVTPKLREEFALAFENAVTDVLIKKTEHAIEQTGAYSLVLGGGVSASPHLREQFTKHFKQTHPKLNVHFPNPGLSTDNSVMIALAGHARVHEKLQAHELDTIRAEGRRRL